MPAKLFFAFVLLAALFVLAPILGYVGRVLPMVLH